MEILCEDCFLLLLIWAGWNTLFTSQSFFALVMGRVLKFYPANGYATPGLKVKRQGWHEPWQPSAPYRRLGKPECSSPFSQTGIVKAFSHKNVVYNPFGSISMVSYPI